MRAALALAGLAVAALVLAVSPVGAAPSAYRCDPTPNDGAGPFGRGMPPVRAKIGSGHVLTGLVRSAVTCGPLARARVEFMQSGRDGYTRAGTATVVAGPDGRFRFEGPRPVDYGREPHIHIRVIAAGYKPLLTRYVVRGRSGQITLTLEPEDL
jgi:hypothetical protein